MVEKAANPRFTTDIDLTNGSIQSSTIFARLEAILRHDRYDSRRLIAELSPILQPPADTLALASEDVLQGIIRRGIHMERYKETRFSADRRLKDKLTTIRTKDGIQKIMGWDPNSVMANGVSSAQGLDGVEARWIPTLCEVLSLEDTQSALTKYFAENKRFYYAPLPTDMIEMLQRDYYKKYGAPFKFLAATQLSYIGDVHLLNQPNVVPIKGEVFSCGIEEVNYKYNRRSKNLLMICDANWLRPTEVNLDMAQ